MSMTESSLPTTRVTLLTRLRTDPSDGVSWDEFVERYGRHIYRWCHQWKLQDADAEDLTQNILLKIFRTLPVFAYDPSRSFRGWLKTVAYRAWWDYRNRRQTQAAAGDSEATEIILTLEARQDLAERLEQAFDLELLEAAKTRVRERVASHTWEAFHLLAYERLPVEEVAVRVEMQTAMVYVAKSKVQKMLREEIALLEKGM
jgi:RNA polymerase sigma-70 factor (ECF subfamily)